MALWLQKRLKKNNKMELEEVIERLEEKLKNIPSQYSCINSRVPEGRVWCDYYKQTFAGRCSYSCPDYGNRYLTNKS